MKKTIAVIGSAAALSLSGAGIAAAQSELPFPIPGSSDPTAEAPADDTTGDDGAEGEDENTGEEGTGTEGEETTDEASELAAQICGAVATIDVLGSVGSIAPGLEGDDCAVTADQALALVQEGDIQGAVDLLTGVEVEEPADDEGTVDEDTVDETEAAEGAA
ncbi:hypothetical protein [Dietzia sp. 179-F 9C3 NHS]|uniref:hypothetical protein n=1 Tax=Dietzia sp. 179-F 9C3 NHS TaxID=3374295 RepID=UPI0038794732